MPDWFLAHIAKHLASEQLITSAHQSAAPASATRAAAGTSCGDPAAGAGVDDLTCIDVVTDELYDRVVTGLLQALSGFAAAPLTGQGPTADAWRGVLALPSYAAAVNALKHRMQLFCQALDGLMAYRRQQKQQQQVGDARGAGGVATTSAAAGLELDQTSQQHKPRQKHKQQQQRQQPAGATAQQAAGGKARPAASDLSQHVQPCYRQAVRVWALLCALAPSRHMFNGLLCRSFRTVSESFALVRGRACVCGCCVAQAAAHSTSKGLVCR